MKLPDTNEPELNYPIKFHHRDYPHTKSVVYEFVVGSNQKIVIISGETAYDWWDEGKVRDFIEKGIWIVDSSGKLPDQSASHSKDVVLGSIKIEIKDSTEAVNQLTKALDKCTKAFERMQINFRNYI